MGRHRTRALCGGPALPRLSTPPHHPRVSLSMSFNGRSMLHTPTTEKLQLVGGSSRFVPMKKHSVLTRSRLVHHRRSVRLDPGKCRSRTRAPSASVVTLSSWNEIYDALVLATTTCEWSMPNAGGRACLEMATVAPQQAYRQLVIRHE